MTRLRSEIRAELGLRQRRVQRPSDRLRLVIPRAIPEAERQIRVPVYDGDGVGIRSRGPDGLGQREEFADCEGLFGRFRTAEDVGREARSPEEAGLLADYVGGDEVAG